MGIKENRMDVLSGLIDLLLDLMSKPRSCNWRRYILTAAMVVMILLAILYIILALSEFWLPILLQSTPPQS